MRSDDALSEPHQPPCGERAVELAATGTLAGAVGLVPSFGPFGKLPITARSGSRIGAIQVVGLLEHEPAGAEPELRATAAAGSGRVGFPGGLMSFQLALRRADRLPSAIDLPSSAPRAARRSRTSREV